MSKATAAITDKFKKTYVRSLWLDMEQLQQAYFKLGFSWYDKERNVLNTPMTYIRVNQNCELSYDNGAQTPEVNGYSGYREVSMDEVLEAAEEVRKIKRAEGKEQKKRAAKRKWEATAIKHTTGTCPVQPASRTIVACKLRSGAVLTGPANQFDWYIDNMEMDVASYKVVGYKKPKEVSMEQMVTDIAADMGKAVAVPFNADDFFEVERDTAPVDTNPKKQYGLASIPLNLWSPLASAYGALGLYNGSLKYGAGNFCNTPVEASIYIAAAMRHLSAWAAGEEFDPADGVPNLGGVLANIAILLESRAAGKLIDDRVRMSGYLKERDALKAIVPALQKVHEGKTPKHYTLGE